MAHGKEGNGEPASEEDDEHRGQLEPEIKTLREIILEDELKIINKALFYCISFLGLILTPDIAYNFYFIIKKKEKKDGKDMEKRKKNYLYIIITFSGLCCTDLLSMGKGRLSPGGGGTDSERLRALVANPRAEMRRANIFSEILYY